jgi:PAS domain-containing protein
MHSISKPVQSAITTPVVAEVLRDVFVLRRRVSIGVYSVVALYTPLYLLFGFSLAEAGVLVAVAVLITSVTVHLVFRQIVALRKRSAYPEAIAQAVAEVDESTVAATRSLEVVQSLLAPQAAFLSLIAPSGAPVVVACHSVTTDAALELLSRHAEDLEVALDNDYPRDISGAGDDVRIVLVPLVAMRKKVGVLYLADRQSNRDLADRLLLATIGAAIGMALDSLVQKEQILQKESRLRSLTMGAPVILFAIDNDGLITFLQGKGIERLGVSPQTVIGRSTTEVFATYPQVLQGFRRAFAGEEVTAVVTLTVQ